MRFNKLGLSIVLSISFVSLADASSLSYYDSAWFLNSSKTVRYCIDRDPNFSISSTEINSTITWAVAKWVSYMDTQNLSARPVEFQLARKFALTDNCDSADLKFLFGIQNAQIDQYKAQDFYHPLSFARRTAYDSQTGWGQGIVWVDSDEKYAKPPPAIPLLSWKTTSKMKGILLHEMGHVFGVGHLDGTIMRANISDSLIDPSDSYPNPDLYSITNITNAWELMSSPKNNWVNGAQYNQLGQIAGPAFKALVGREPQGSVRGSWLVLEKTILVEDDLGQYTLAVQINYESRNKITDSPLFYAYRKNSKLQNQWVNAERETSIKIGTLKNISGSQLIIVIEKNVYDRQLSIRYQPGAGYSVVPLFTRDCKMTDVPLHGSYCFPIYPKDEG